MSSTAEEDLEADICFLACTRPAMVMGVTMEAFGFNVVGTVITCLLVGSFRYVVIGLVFHYVFRALIWHDHNRFRVLLAWLETRGRMRNGLVWGGSSVTPLVLGRAYSEKDLRDA